MTRVPNKPGDTFTYEGYEFIAVADRGSDNGCDDCIGNISRALCGELPTHCFQDGIVWHTNNEAANTLQVIYKLEGKK